MGEPCVRYQPPAAPGAPRHAQNRLTFIEAKHAARARVRHSRANPVLDPLERCGPRQIFVGRQLREIERAIIGRHGRKDEPLLELDRALGRSEEHTSELQSLMRISYAVFCLKKNKNTNKENYTQCVL